MKGRRIKVRTGANTTLGIRRALRCALLLLFSMSAWVWSQSSPASEIVIRPLAEGKKIIPIYYHYDPIWQTDIKLPALVVRNDSSSEAAIQKVHFVGRSSGKDVICLTMHEDQTAGAIAEAGRLLNELASDPGHQWKTYNLKKIFGRVPLPAPKFSESARLPRGATAAVAFTDPICLHYQGPAKLTEMLVKIQVTLRGQEREFEYPTPLTPYECRGDYVFPLAGSAAITFTPTSGHRVLASSEFAIDIVDYRRLPDGQLSLSSPPRSEHVRDYFANNRDVMAIGDGVVVRTGNGWPDEWMENPLQYSEERVGELTVELLKQGVEFENAYIGNYVIIDHQNGEFSSYVHFAQNSIPVKPGDRVRQGQVIGRVGNTANSTDPHLHFQLMDSSEYVSANGLPVMFKNLRPPMPPVWDMDQANTVFYSDYLFVFTPPLKAPD